MIDQNVLYSECPCGSGKKFKFCCYPAIRYDLPDDPIAFLPVPVRTDRAERRPYRAAPARR